MLEEYRSQTMGDSHLCICAPSPWDLLWWTSWDPREQLDIRKRFLPEFKRCLDNAFQNMVWILVVLVWIQKLVIIMDPNSVILFHVVYLDFSILFRTLIGVCIDIYSSRSVVFIWTMTEGYLSYMRYRCTQKHLWRYHSTHYPPATAIYFK